LEEPAVFIFGVEGVLNKKVTGYPETAVANFSNNSSNNNNNNIFITLYNNLTFLDAFTKQLQKATVRLGMFLRRNLTKAPTGEIFS
jgi:hypothetical protein